MRLFMLTAVLLAALVAGGSLVGCSGESETSVGAAGDSVPAVSSTQLEAEGNETPRIEVPEWVDPEVAERIEAMSPAEATAFMETMEIFSPAADGELGADEAARRAARAADEPESVVVERDVTVFEATRASAAEVLGESADSDPRLGASTPVLLAVVNAPITQTEGPAGSTLETYERYVVVFEPVSQASFEICMGCPAGQAATAALDGLRRAFPEP